jgi:hypothetical protein
MALTLTYTHPQTGATYRDAYLRCKRVLIDAGIKAADMRVTIYASEEAARAGLDPVVPARDITVHDVPARTVTVKTEEGPVERELPGEPAFSDAFGPAALDQANPYATVYALLKARPEFAGARDT